MAVQWLEKGGMKWIFGISLKGCFLQRKNMVFWGAEEKMTAYEKYSYKVFVYSYLFIFKSIY